MWKRLEIQFLRFSTGQPHDLASGVSFGLELNCKSPSECEIAMEVMGPYLILIVGYKSRLRLARRHQRIYFAEWTKGSMRCVSCVRNTVSQTDIHCHGRFGRFGTAPTFR
jgi:hypothetical protein